MDARAELKKRLAQFAKGKGGGSFNAFKQLRRVGGSQDSKIDLPEFLHAMRQWGVGNEKTCTEFFQACPVASDHRPCRDSVVTA